MTTYTTLADSVLQADKPVTEAVGRAMGRDNLQATVEGDASVPATSRIKPRSIYTPYFLASRTTDYTVATPGGSTWKVAFDTETYDPYSLYDNTANSGNGYRFTPNEPGVYLVTVHVQIQAVSNPAGAPTRVSAVIRKNGSVFASASNGKSGNSNGDYTAATVTALVQMNGSTDYIEGWVNDGVSSGISPSNPVQGYFMAVGVGRT